MGNEVEDGGVTPLYWDLGRGMSMIFATDLHGYHSERWVKDWGYWHDFVPNLEYYSCGVDVPSDPEIMHHQEAAKRQAGGFSYLLVRPSS